MTNHWADLRNADAFMVCGSNPTENHPCAWKWVEEARDKRGAKLIVVDPRYTRTAAKADVFSFLRPGTDIAFFGGLINYAIKNNYIQWEYVINYTNAPFLVVPEFSFDTKTGIFSGYDKEKRKYSNATWNVQYSDPVNKTKPYRVALVDVEDMANVRGKPTAWTTPGDPKTCPVNKDTPDYPLTVFGKLEEFYSRYTPEMVEKITGIPQDKFKQLAEAYCATTYKPEKSGNLMYAMGLTQHTIGVENIRCFGVLQLLLGNTGLPGGGINALRGESNVQGSTDFGLLYNLLPGYIASPTAKEKDLATYNAATAPDKISGFQTNRSKWMASMLKSWWPGVAKEQGLDAAYALLPKRENGADYSHIPLFEAMYAGTIKGMISWGQNPPVGGPNANLEAKAMENLEWYAAVDLWDTEAMNFWRRPGTNAKDVATKVYALPAASSIEKAGSVANSGRLAQYRWRAVEPPGEAESDLWICDQLMTRLKALYADDKNAPVREAVTGVFWEYERDEAGEIDIDNIALECGGFIYPEDTKGIKDFWDKARAKSLTTFANLKDDGSTACCNWIYGGIYASLGKKDDGTYNDGGMNYVVNTIKVPEAEVPRYKAKWRWQADPNNIYKDQPGLGVNPYWGYSWPVNRRVIYNRCAADYAGQPWAQDKALVSWNGSKWVNNDIPDFTIADAVTAAVIPPEDNGNGMGKGPYLMVTNKDSQLGLLFTGATAEGPFPEHYEPREGPVTNVLTSTQWNPAAVLEYQSAKDDPEKYGFAETGSTEYPYIGTTYRVTEHWQAGQMTRSLSWLGEAMPEMFVELSPTLANKLGIKKGDLVEVSSVRGVVQGVAVVTARLQPITVGDGSSGTKDVEVVGMVWHYGYTGLFPGGPERGEQGKIAKRNYAANLLTPHVGDANTTIPEYKAFLVNLKKVS
jgi:formate dehydrogenase major subunit